MLLFRSTLVGLATAVAACVLWILVKAVLPIVVPVVVSRFSNQGGAAGAYITSDSILIAAVMGFAAGFFWRFRRQRRHPSSTRNV